MSSGIIFAIGSPRNKVRASAICGSADRWQFLPHGCGEEVRMCSSHDSHGMKMLRAHEIGFASISGNELRYVELCVRNRGITFVYQNAENKLQAFEKLLMKLGLDT